MIVLHTSTIDFLKDLKTHNYREWFAEQKKRYETAKADFENFALELLNYLKSMDKELEPLELKQCVYRIYRDVRFSPNKEPYKTHFGAFYAKNGGRKSNHAGYYFHLDAEECFFGGGMYMPLPDYLKAIRQEIYYQPKEFKAILNASSFKAYYNGIDPIEKLKKAPKDYPADFEEIELLKNKHFFASHYYRQETALEPDFLAFTKQGLAAVKPLVDWINRTVEV